MKLYPKCHPYWEIDGEKIQNPEVIQVAYIAQGYLLPCCWCDAMHPNQRKSMEMLGLFDEELKVENVDDIELEILASPEWYKFHNTLLQEPHNAPPACKKKCGKP
jgi:hypothetical protein